MEKDKILNLLKEVIDLDNETLYGNEWNSINLIIERLEVE
jgi:hypothetical protein